MSTTGEHGIMTAIVKAWLASLRVHILGDFGEATYVGPISLGTCSSTSVVIHFSSALSQPVENNAALNDHGITFDSKHSFLQYR